MELANLEFKRENFGEREVVDGFYIISIKPPWNQYVKGLASRAIKSIYISAEADLSKMLLHVDKKDSVKVFNYTPSEKEKKIIINLLGEKYDGRTSLGSKQYRTA